MLTEDHFKLLQRYSRQLAKLPQDAEDIFQDSIEMYLKNPSEQELNNTFLFTVVRRTRFNYYFKMNTKKRKVQEVYPNDFEEVSKVLTDTETPEKLYTEIEAVRKLKTITGNYLTKQEKALLKKIVTGYTPEYADRTHYANLEKKVTKLLT